MLKSMTAYGNASATFSLGRISVELLAVNRKHLEIQSFIPRELQRFDHDIRKLISHHFQRGQLTLRLQIRYTTAIPITVSANLPLVQQTWQAWRLIAQSVGAPEQLSLQLLVSDPSLLTSEADTSHDAVLLEAIKEVLSQAIQQMEKMRQIEGQAIANELLKRLDLLKELNEKIANKATDAVERYRTKLHQRLSELSSLVVEHEERLLREVCLFADRIDISEEISRLRLHFKQFEKMVHSEISVGKTLEFLMQEMGREVNTIGSKASDIVISHLVVEMKSELEKMREQIQNVE